MHWAHARSTRTHRAGTGYCVFYRHRLTLEDFADLASDELTGGYDVIKGERVKIQGYLEDFALSKIEADELIMSARNIVYKD